MRTITITIEDQIDDYTRCIADYSHHLRATASPRENKIAAALEMALTEIMTDVMPEIIGELVANKRGNNLDEMMEDASQAIQLDRDIRKAGDE